MKKLMTLMLGLSIALGSFSMFAQNNADKKTTEKKKKSPKKKKDTKKTDAKS